MTYNIVALVPMRHHSQRVPGKNYRPLGGKPLYQHVIETLLACPEIDRVVVDTDSPPIVAGLKVKMTLRFHSLQVYETSNNLSPRNWRLVGHVPISNP